MLKIKDIEKNQIIYAMDDYGESYSFKASKPVCIDGKWQVEAEDSGNYSYTFFEEDESILFIDDTLGEAS